VLSALVVGCAALRSGREQLPARHPEVEWKGRPICTDCHSPGEGPIAFADFVHTPDWMSVHRQRAYQHDNVCSLCHKQSWCNDCHVTRVELKPSLKGQLDTYRRMPHRGDYLTRHRVDAAIDPTSCFRCHGNPKSSKTCRPCHT
jgi:hypothetical protein